MLRNCFSFEICCEIVGLDWLVIFMVVMKLLFLIMVIKVFIVCNLFMVVF